jgi:hypothetical protein
LAIFVFARDVDSQKKLEKEFPGIPWKITKIYFSNPQGEDFAYLMEVPFERLTDNPKAEFNVQTVSPWTWRRRFYGSFGLGRGFIRYEDRVTHWNEKITVKENDVTNGSQRIEGDFNVPSDGDYIFTLRTGNVYQFDLDGQRVFTVERYDKYQGGKKTIHLKAGVHHVAVANACTVGQGVDSVMIQAPGAPQAVSLEDYSLSTAPTDSISASEAKN